MKEDTTYVEYTDAPDEQSERGPLQSIDFDKLFSVLKKSLPVIVVIFLVCNMAAYLYVRYTKPLYQSNSELQLTENKPAASFGFVDSDKATMEGMSSEIELIKSKLFLNKVLAALDLDVSYYTQGKILDDEKYRSSPFKVQYLIKDERFFNQKIFVNIHDHQEYTLSYFLDDQEVSNRYRFGQTVETGSFSLTLALEEGATGDAIHSSYYFIINSDQSLIDYLSNNLTVTILNPNAKTIKISLTDYNPYKARVVVDAVSNMYLTYKEEEQIKANNQKIAFLNTLVEDAESKLEGYETYFEDFTISQRTTNLSKDISNTILMLESVDSQRVATRRQLNNLTNLSSRIKSEDTYFAQSLVNRAGSDFPADIKTLLDQLNKLISEKEVLLEHYNENTQAAQLKIKQVSLIKEDLLAALHLYESDLRKQVEDLQFRHRELLSSFVQLPSKGTEFSKSQRDYNQLLEVLLNLQSKKIEFEIANAGSTTDYKILSSASMPGAPISPDRYLFHGIGLAAGLMLSLLFVGGRYVLDNKVNGVAEVERLANVPVLGAVPLTHNKLATARMVITDNPKSAFSESMRAIRTNMEFMGARQNNRIISVTSTVSGEGKTFVTTNLAAIIALSKKKVLVLDLDMRKPKVHLAFEGENSSAGVSTVLIGRHSLEESIRKTSIPNLDYIPAGPTPPNPSELVMNGDFDKLLLKLQDLYDVIVMDTPPVGLVTDGILIMKKADLPLYVFKANYSHKAYFKTLNRLATVNQFNNLAVILNGVSRNKGYGYGYGYGYGDSGGYYEE
ncbi:polysaccharide biosynthesis tyrosine autokinase [Cesiribacter sp. SM1]|uniref:GumC family protein n=1 Tax=Cesiribacter sp. SM1 TaxID=2861196 RepID=UPI001CD79B37|nr:polysaccharide biosynthesis tyrosine autokinase [Cesiribacter sp. SM1]